MSDFVSYEAELPDLEDPLLLAAFGGAWGTSAAFALRKLAERWETTSLAEIDPQCFYDFGVQRPLVRVDDGERKLEWARNEFLLARPKGARRNLVLLIGAEPQLRWGKFVEAITTAMERLGVKDSLILGAYRAATPHSRPLPVQLYSSNDELAEQFGLVPEQWSYEGPTGITTPLSIACEQRGWSSSSLMIAAPFYVSVEPHPFAARALIQTLSRGLGFEFDVSGLDEQIHSLCEEAEDARVDSEPFSQFIANLEQEYDDSLPALNLVDTPAVMPAPELLEDVESFLRKTRDAGDHGSPSSGMTSGSP
jgi:proteasome assembly chaperone (PAC2) family protein